MRRRLWMLSLLMTIAAGTAWAQEEVLPPEEAFKFSVHLADAQTLEWRYVVAEGYYLYRDKFKFSAEGAALGTPRLPPGKIHQDEFFGRVETYRGELSIRVPLIGADHLDAVDLKAQFQGCADAGICYTPQTRLTTLRLSGGQGDANPVQAGGGALSRLRSLPADSPASLAEDAKEEEFLPVELAFRIRLVAKDAQTLHAIFSPAPTYYLYRDKIKLGVVRSPDVSITKLTLPRGEMKTDPNFGDTEVFHHDFKAEARLARTEPTAKTIEVDVQYQGCSEKGLCYPPTTKRLRVALASLLSPIGEAAAQSPASVAEPPAEAAPSAPPTSTASPATPLDESSQVTELLRNASFWGVVLSFLGFGLLLALTPCVFPMIPILSGIIVGQGSHITRARSLGLSAVYVFGMALAYAIAGVLAGLSGSLLTSALQNSWVLGAFALLFVALALSMFGFYDLQIPSGLQSRLTEISNRQRRGTLGGVFFMGMLSALIVGPCVAAPLAGALAYISQSRDVVLGGSALFAMALGMGVPLLLVGWTTGALLPRAGAWMHAVKQFFGVLLLAVALWLISPVIPAVAQMLGWAALLIVSAIYLHALDPLPSGASGRHKFFKGVGVLALLLGIAQLVGALAGGRDPLQPLAGIASGGTPVHRVKFERVMSLAELDQRIALAAGRPVMLDFYADWCVSCKEMERYTFSDAQVQAALAGFVLLQADVTRNTADDAALLKRFGLFGPPGIVFFDAEGREHGTRVIGFQSPGKFLQALRSVAR